MCRVSLFAALALSLANTSTTDALQKKKAAPMDILAEAADRNWQLFDKKGEAIDKGKIRGTKEGKLFKDLKEIGSWKKTGKDQFQVEFTETVIKGKAELKLMPATRFPSYQGELMREDGKFTLRMKLYKD